jgi:CheY-like chemotaxis protein
MGKWESGVPIVLLVEDDEDLRTDLAQILRAHGHEVETAENGAEALAWLNSGHSSCLILLDLMMPVLDGWGFRAKQLSNPCIAGIPVVVLSGAGDVHRDALSLQAAGYLTKPFTLNQVLATVEQFAEPAGPGTLGLT